jgi:hypothetical protein
VTDPAPNNLNFDCNWRYGFNLDTKRKGMVGYVLFWSGCGGLTLAQDIEVWNPFSSGGQTVLTGPQIECVGLIEAFRFNGDTQDPIRVSLYVSKGTAANVRAKLAIPLTTTKLQFAFYIIGFDDERKTWYEAAFVQDAIGKVNAVVDTVNGNLQLFVSNEPTPLSDHLDIQVHKLEFQAVPADGKPSLLQFATGPTTRIIRQWGASDS